MKKAIVTSGKRKTSTARASLKEGTGVCRINSVLLNNIKPEILKIRIQEPIILADKVAENVDINVTVNGGGVTSQANAIRLAIARALVEYDKKLEKDFLAYDRQLLVADVRRKEVCKPNDSKARAKRQKSYR